MSLFIASLNSGSNGNCYYIGNNNEAVLIDAGISCRETEKRMKRLGLRMDKVKAVFISHEHADHIYGITTLSGKFKIPVYITAATLQHSGLPLSGDLIIPFTANNPVTIGGLSVKAFSKFHDANDPHSFTVESVGVKIGVITDIGFACSEVIHHFKQCHAAFLEANYDEAMLATGNYPYHLKKRISGGNGHLSNTQALDLFLAHRPAFMSHLILSHLSKNNNKPQIVEDLFAPHAGNIKIVIASRYAETALYEVSGAGDAVVHNVKKINGPARQLALF